MTRTITIALMASASMLAGCATSVSQQGPEVATDVPPRFVAGDQSGGQIDGRWWENFGDPQLNAYINEAVIENPSIGQALARVEQARAQANITGANLLPQVNGSFNASRRKQNLGSIPGVAGDTDTQTSVTTNNFGLSLDVSWEPDLWGRLSAQSAAARADFLASAANLRATRQSIAAETARTYFSVVEARQQVELSERVVETFGEITRQISNRADVGIAAPNDKTLAIANLESAKAGLQQRREALARATRQLDILLRNYPDGTVRTANALPELYAPVPAGLPAELLARRPDVVAAELNLRASGFRLDAAQKSLLPSINLTGSAGTSSSSIADLVDPSFFIWSIAGSILQPIFQGGRLRAQVDLAEGQEKEALENYAAVVLRAFAEVETGLAVGENIRAREASLLIAAQSAERSVDISFNRYRAGIDPFLNVLESQQRALDSRSAYIAARRASLENRIALHLALGGGFEEDPLASVAKD